jgi:hypothetical protein
MATFPITIANTTAQDKPRFAGAYSTDNNTRYFLRYPDLGAGETQVVMMKSTDQGQTWNAVNAGNGPELGLQQFTSVLSPDGTTIYVAYSDNTTTQIALAAFTLAGETWGSFLAPFTPDFVDVRAITYDSGSGAIYVFGNFKLGGTFASVFVYAGSWSETAFSVPAGAAGLVQFLRIGAVVNAANKMHVILIFASTNVVIIQGGLYHQAIVAESMKAQNIVTNSTTPFDEIAIDFPVSLAYDGANVAILAANIPFHTGTAYYTDSKANADTIAFSLNENDVAQGGVIDGVLLVLAGAFHVFIAVLNAEVEYYHATAIGGALTFLGQTLPDGGIDDRALNAAVVELNSDNDWSISFQSSQGYWANFGGAVLGSNSWFGLPVILPDPSILCSFGMQLRCVERCCGNLMMRSKVPYAKY